MVIEDESLLLQAITKKLKASGYETVSCTNAKQAIEYLENMDQLPDLIWLDFYLKDMNGMEFMDKLNKNEQWKNVPVVVVSNSASKQKVDQMLSKGVKEYVLKAEHTLDDLVGIIKRYTEKEGVDS